MKTRAEALLDAHVNWIDNELKGAGLREQAAELLNGLLADAEKLKLKDVTNPAAIHATVQKYAVNLKLGGAIPVLVGEIARNVYELELHDETLLQELVPDPVFEDGLDKLLELKSLRKSLITECVNNPVFSGLISELLANGIGDYIANSTKSAERLPGVKSGLKFSKALASKARPTLGASLNDSLRTTVQKNTQTSLKASEQYLHEAFESEEIRQAVLDIWNDNKHHSVASLRDFVGSLDIEELFVIFYEYWLHLRKTPFYTGIINRGVDTFFERFNNETLATLISEIGITHEMMLDDVMRFAPSVIASARKKKLLKPAIRRSLQGFYDSNEAQAILA